MPRLLSFFLLSFFSLAQPERPLRCFCDLSPPPLGISYSSMVPYTPGEHKTITEKNNIDCNRFFGLSFSADSVLRQLLLERVGGDRVYWYYGISVELCWDLHISLFQTAFVLCPERNTQICTSQLRQVRGTGGWTPPEAKMISSDPQRCVKRSGLRSVLRFGYIVWLALGTSLLWVDVFKPAAFFSFLFSIRKPYTPYIILAVG